MALAACTVPVRRPGGHTRGASQAQVATASEQAFLNYWTGWSGFEFDELQKMVDKFNEANTDKVFVNMTTVFGQYEKVLTAIAGGNPPDVVSTRCGCTSWCRWPRGGLQPITQVCRRRPGIDGSEYFRAAGTPGSTTATCGA